MYSNNRGDRVLPVDLKLAIPEAAPEPEMPRPTGAVGVGTWATTSEYKDMKVASGDDVLYAIDPATATKEWKLGSGNWKWEDGALRQTGDETNCRATVGDPNWTDYTFTLKAQKLSGPEGFLILFHVKSPNDWLWWNIGGWGNSRSAFQKGEHGGDHELGASKQLTVENDRWYDIKVEVKDRQIRGYIDGKLVAERTDASQPPPTPPAQSTPTRCSDDSSGDVILKVVNTQEAPRTVAVDLKGVASVGKEARLEVLTRSPRIRIPLKTQRRSSLKRLRSSFPAQVLSTRFQHTPSMYYGLTHIDARRGRPIVFVPHIHSGIDILNAPSFCLTVAHRTLLPSTDHKESCMFRVVYPIFALPALVIPLFSIAVASDAATTTIPSPAHTMADEKIPPVTAPPASVFDHVRERDRDAARQFYKKYIDVGGLVAMASGDVADEALQRTYYIVTHMLAGRPDVLAAMQKNGTRLIIIGKDQVYTDMPEYRNSPNPAFQNERVRGTGGFDITSFGEENLLNLPLDRYDDESIGVHEFCHTVDAALRRIDPDWPRHLRETYQNAVDKGRWKFAYTGSNQAEYWAEICQSYFDTNRVNNWNHSSIATREQLKEYDPEGYELTRVTFNLSPANDWRYTPLRKQPSVIPPPEKFKIDPYYTKFTWAREFIVLGSDKVSDEALLKANHTIRRMFSYRHDILKALINDGAAG